MKLAPNILAHTSLAFKMLNQMFSKIYIWTFFSLTSAMAAFFSFKMFLRNCNENVKIGKPMLLFIIKNKDCVRKIKLSKQSICSLSE